MTIVSRALALAAALGASGATRDPSESATATRGAVESSGSATPRAPTQPGADRHLLMSVRLSAGEAVLVDLREVAQPLRRPRARSLLPWKVVVEDAGGVVLFEQEIPAANLVRGEFAGRNGAVEAVHLRVSTASFAVRLPVLAAGATVRFLGRAASLPDGDARRGSARDAAMVMLGSLPYPRRFR